MDAKTVGDLFTRDRRSDRSVLEDATGRSYDYHWVCTSTWKAGNFLRHAGIRNGVTVGIVGDGPLTLLSFFGAALLEGATRFDPPRDLADATDLRALVGPIGVLEEYDLPRGAQHVGYGGKPTDPAVHHLDAGLWSENPSFPPLEIDPDTSLLTDGERFLTHGEALEAATEIGAEWGLDEESRVAIESPLASTLADPRVAVAGVLAPLVVGGTIVLVEPVEADETGEVEGPDDPGPTLDRDVDLTVGCERLGVDRLEVDDLEVEFGWESEQ